LSAINRLLLLVKFTKEAEPTFNIFIELIVKKINELNRDRTGKVQLTLLKTYTLQTFLNIEKSTSVILLFNLVQLWGEEELDYSYFRISKKLSYYFHTYWISNYIIYKLICKIEYKQSLSEKYII
jgi:DNA-binding transcriptional regulator/RsmH inhibitor MraZ